MARPGSGVGGAIAQTGWTVLPSVRVNTVGFGVARDPAAAGAVTRVGVWPGGHAMAPGAVRPPVGAGVPSAAADPQSAPPSSNAAAAAARARVRRGDACSVRRCVAVMTAAAYVMGRCPLVLSAGVPDAWCGLGEAGQPRAGGGES